MLTRKVLRVYEYGVPVVMFPLSYLLWLQHYAGRHDLVALALSMPVVAAYVVPGLGTNWLQLWEFHTHLRLGRFRPHHGFVFGTATSLLALLCVDQPAPQFGWLDMARSAFIMGSVLGFWNWWYDILAIRAGVLRVYNRPYAEGRGAEAIATAYAPVYFGAFGAAYGAVLYLGQQLLQVAGRADILAALLVAGNLTVVVVPVAAYVLMSYLTTGTAGLRPFHIEQR